MWRKITDQTDYALLALNIIMLPHSTGSFNSDQKTKYGWSILEIFFIIVHVISFVHHHHASCIHLLLNVMYDLTWIALDHWNQRRLE